MGTAVALPVVVMVNEKLLAEPLVNVTAGLLQLVPMGRPEQAKVSVPE